MTPYDMNTFLDDTGHVPAAEMARYVDGASDRVTRARLTHHLADCEECREELTALRRLVPPRSRMTTRVGAILGAAAAVMLITLSWRGSLTSRLEESSPDRTRAQGGVAEIDAPLAVVAPSMGAIVSVLGVIALCIDNDLLRYVVLSLAVTTLLLFSWRMILSWPRITVAAERRKKRNG